MIRRDVTTWKCSLKSGVTLEQTLLTFVCHNLRHANDVHLFQIAMTGKSDVHLRQTRSVGRALRDSKDLLAHHTGTNLLGSSAWKPTSKNKI